MNNKKLEKWSVIKLGDKIHSTIIKSGINKYQGTKKYLSTRSIKGDKIVQIQDEITYNDRQSRANMQPIYDSVWFAKMKDTLKVYLFTNNNKDEINNYILSTGFSGIKCRASIYSPYLKQIFLSEHFNRYKNRFAEGSTQKAISNDDIKLFEFGLPPLDEQRGIVEVVGTVDRCIRLTDEVIENAEEMKQGLMQQLITKGLGHTEYKEWPQGKIPKTWKIEKLGTLLRLIEYGLSYSLSEEGKYPIFRMNNLENGYVVENDLKFIDLDDNEFQKYRLKKGDILFNRTNSYDLVGKVGIYLLKGDHTFASYLIRLRTKLALDPKFLNFFLNLEQSQNTLRRLATRGVSQSNINAQSLKSIKILLPPIQEQLKIVEIIENQDKFTRNEILRKKHLNLIKQGLMQQLLSGKIRVELREDGLHRIRDGGKTDN